MLSSDEPAKLRTTHTPNAAKNPTGDLDWTRKTELDKTVILGKKSHYLILREVVTGKLVQYFLCERLDVEDPAEKYCFCAVAKAGDETTLSGMWDVLEAVRDEAEWLSNGRVGIRDGFLGLRNLELEEKRELWKRGERMERLPSVDGGSATNSSVRFDEFFPVVIERLVLQDQWGKLMNRQAAILEVRQAYSQLMPLSLIVKKGYRVDLKTSAWIMSKMLKLILFYRCHRLSVDGFLINPVGHDLVYLDWSKSWRSNLAEVDALWSNVQRAAQIALQLLDARRDTSGREIRYDYPYPIEPDEEEYLKVLNQMATLGDEFCWSIRLVYDIHRIFCGAVEKTWGMSFYPFMTYPIEYPENGKPD